MSKSNGFENAWLRHVFHNEALAGIGDAAGLQPSATAGSLFLGLHTGDPGEAGVQTTHECTYTSYNRVAVPRNASNWTVSGNAVANTSLVSWPTPTAGSESASHFSVGISGSGASMILYRGSLTWPYSITTGASPQASAGELDIVEY